MAAPMKLFAQVLKGPNWIQPIFKESGDTQPPPPPTRSVRKRLGDNHCHAPIEQSPLLYLYQIIPGLPLAEK